VATRADVIIATGRSDFPNQINNVIAFPPLFRGALDCRAKCVRGAQWSAVCAIEDFSSSAQWFLPAMSTWLDQQASYFGLVLPWC
jgi:malic enzyme